MDNFWIDLVLRWLHLLPAVVLGGGLVFLRMVWTGGGSDVPGSNWDRIRPQWARLVGICSGLLLLTGLVNGVRNILDYQFLQPGYHGLVALKLVLGIAVFAIAALLAGRTPLARRMQDRMSSWLSIAAVLVVALVLVGGWMRMIERVPKDAKVITPEMLLHREETP
jgi:putative copper export protein